MTRPVEPIYARIGAAVRSAREASELSQEQLATGVGLTRTSITNLELGRQQTPLHVLYAIAIVLEVPVKELLPDEAEHRPIEQPEIWADDVERWTALATSTTSKTRRSA